MKPLPEEVVEAIETIAAPEPAPEHETRDQRHHREWQSRERLLLAEFVTRLFLRRQLIDMGCSPDTAALLGERSSIERVAALEDVEYIIRAGEWARSRQMLHAGLHDRAGAALERWWRDACAVPALDPVFAHVPDPRGLMLRRPPNPWASSAGLDEKDRWRVMEIEKWAACDVERELDEDGRPTPSQEALVAGLRSTPAALAPLFPAKRRRGRGRRP